MTLMPSRRAGAAGAMTVVAAICYVAAVVIALPLGVSGVIKEEYCAIPLAAANILLAFAMISTSRR
jgi:hypothetical protein